MKSAIPVIAAVLLSPVLAFVFTYLVCVGGASCGHNAPIYGLIALPFAIVVVIGVVERLVKSRGHRGDHDG